MYRILFYTCQLLLRRPIQWKTARKLISKTDPSTTPRTHSSQPPASGHLRRPTRAAGSAPRASPALLPARRRPRPRPPRAAGLLPCKPLAQSPALRWPSRRHQPRPAHIPVADRTQRPAPALRPATGGPSSVPLLLPALLQLLFLEGAVELCNAAAAVFGQVPLKLTAFFREAESSCVLVLFLARRRRASRSCYCSFARACSLRRWLVLVLPCYVCYPLLSAICCCSLFSLLSTLAHGLPVKLASGFVFLISMQGRLYKVQNYRVQFCILVSKAYVDMSIWTGQEN
jgi:hypothetical protein